MGNSTTKADTTKLTHCGQNQNIQFVCMQMQGWRKSMQDAAIYELQIPTPQNESNYKNSLFAVFDGHGTSYISRYLSEHFVQVLVSLSDYNNEHYIEALQETFRLLDDMMLSKQGQDELKRIKKQEDQICQHGKYHPIGERIGDFCGSTANVVLITEKFYYVANCGDSRSVLYRSGFCIQLSKDHKPSNPNQVMRIRKANGYVNHGRINDMLSVSRSFGDYELKQQKHLLWSQQALTCKPDIQSFAKSSRDEFILIGCDGIWQNSQQSKQIIEVLINTKQYKQQNYQLALEQFMNKLIARDQQQQFGQDNMTAILIRLLDVHSEKRESNNSTGEKKSGRGSG